VRVLALTLVALLGGCVTHKEQYASTAPGLHVGTVALLSGEPTIAVSVANTRLTQAPEDPDALLLRAQAEAAMQQNGPAVSDFQRVLALRPRSEEAAFGLSRIVVLDDPLAAEALLAPLAVRGSRSAAVWNNLGVVRDLLGRHPEAQAAYRRALALDPTMQSAQVNLGRSLSLSGSGAAGS
jgi:Flp pilus assembly protein TadD